MRRQGILPLANHEVWEGDSTDKVIDFRGSIGVIAQGLVLDVHGFVVSEKFLHSNYKWQP